ncbi:MAG: low molecular weight phosphotyrosine protein phosphatase [Gammaproteobacteria bacterium]|nr:low molecular weight phosphotyrosine protein phosphatase [Gammaproteobacteria bacterium]
MEKIKVIFVCMGNICRSPTAHGVFQSLVEEQGLGDLIEVESAGTHGYHIGNPPDSRSQATASKYNIDLSGLRARQFLSRDFIDFDYVIGMDHANIENMLSIKPAQSSARLDLMLSYSDKYDEKEVPDPYFGHDGFDQVYDMIRDASAGLLRFIRTQHSL